MCQCRFLVTVRHLHQFSVSVGHVVQDHGSPVLSFSLCMTKRISEDDADGKVRTLVISCQQILDDDINLWHLFCTFILKITTCLQFTSNIK